MVRGIGLILRRRDFVPLPPALVAASINVAFPAVPGTPLITPLDVLSDSPLGRPVALYCVGVLVAVI